MHFSISNVERANFTKYLDIHVALRDPEAVERVWTDEADGAWAQGKAPVHLLTSLLRFVQEKELEEAERAARESV